MSINVQDLVDAGVFPDADAAVHHYIIELISVARAAAISGVAFDRMKDILAERGVVLRLGPETIGEAREEVEALRRMGA